jgi:hypothetical protein
MGASIDRVDAPLNSELGRRRGWFAARTVVCLDLWRCLCSDPGGWSRSGPALWW